MITLNTENLSKISPKHGLSAQELENATNLIAGYLEKIHEKKQGFYSVIDDKKTVEDIKKFAKRAESKFDEIIVLGIGGSALGTICLQQSLKHLFENERASAVRKHPRLHVVDNIDPALITSIEDIIDYQKTLFIIVTKSGTTPETLAQYYYYRQRLEKEGLKADEHFVFITDPEQGTLREIARKENMPAFDVPENVGGRFSVLTAVGLLPAALIGITIDKLLAGAQKMRDTFLSGLNKNFEQNLPFQLAAIQYLLCQKGKNINVLFPYSQKLIRFADWYRQLLAESIGKALNKKGEKVNVGITPLNALGVTDQHSQSQLYNEGPNDKLLIFLQVANLGPEIKIPQLHGGISFNKLMQTEMQGTIESLTKNDRPNITITIPAVDEESLGQLFMLFEGATAFLGEFFGINAFDQPGVELSKQITKELLSNTQS